MEARKSDLPQKPTNNFVFFQICGVFVFLFFKFSLTYLMPNWRDISFTGQLFLFFIFYLVYFRNSDWSGYRSRKGKVKWEREAELTTLAGTDNRFIEQNWQSNHWYTLLLRTAASKASCWLLSSPFFPGAGIYLYRQKYQTAGWEGSI